MDSHWREVFPYWLSAARVHWDWLHRLRLWSATAWARKNGILFKTAVSLEETGKMDIVALDKTGTITSGEPRVTDVIPSGGVTEKELVSLALSLEKKSEHPLAKAVLLYAKEQQVDAPEAADFRRCRVMDFPVR